MNHTRLRELYAGLIAGRDPSNRNACVSPEQMSAVVERTSPEAERLALLDHITSCKACLEEFELLRALHVAAPKVRPAQRPRRWMALAASVALVATAALVWRAVWPGPPDVVRGVSQMVSLVSPTEDAVVGLPVELVWRSVEGETRYVVEVLDADGAVAFTEMTADTTLLVPAATPSLSVGTYAWLVVAETRDAGQIRSTPRRFRIQPK